MNLMVMMFKCGSCKNINAYIFIYYDNVMAIGRKYFLLIAKFIINTQN